MKGAAGTRQFAIDKNFFTISAHAFFVNLPLSEFLKCGENDYRCLKCASVLFLPRVTGGDSIRLAKMAKNRKSRLFVNCTSLNYEGRKKVVFPINSEDRLS